MSWVDIQEKAFTRWVNEHLKDRGLRVESLGKDLQDGLLLINLLEIISGKSIGRYNKHPIVPYQKYENNAIAMKFIADEGIKTVNISNEDITNGQLKLILGLIWTLILRYQINKGGDGDGKSELLKWVNSKIPEYNVKNFQKDWNDGKAICALVDALQPGLIPDHRGLNPGNALDNATRGINSAYENLGVPKVLLPEEMVNPRVDEKAVMTYISYLRDLPDNSARSDAGKCRAYGPGLVEGIVNEPAVFYVETPPHTKGKLEIKVEGPKSNAPVNLTKTGDGKWTVKYEPKEPGHYKIHVTLDGNHIPGSIFHVTVLENVSLGGEGKIRVFYSTTSAKDQKTRPLQELFENKGIHKRPDFEPWIPVDIMEAKDRDAVFKKAGTKVLPIIYIDDIYAGDYDRMFQLNASGELDRLLKVRDEELAKKPAPVPYEQLKKTTSAAPKGAPSKGAYRSVPN